MGNKATALSNQFSRRKFDKSGKFLGSKERKAKERKQTTALFNRLMTL